MAAERKPLFMDQTEGFHEEMALNDYLSIGKLTIAAPGSGGVGILMGGNKITGLADGTATGDALAWGQSGAYLGNTTFTGNVDMSNNLIQNLGTPVLPDDAANKAYVDALAQGLDPHPSCIVKVARGLGTQAVLVGSGGSGSVTLTTETMQVKLHSEAAWTTITFSSPADIAAVAAAINTQYGSTIAFVNGNNIDLKDTYWGKNSKVETQNVAAQITTDVGIPNNGSATGTGFTAAGSGVGKTLTAPTNSATYNSIDGFTFTATGASQRVLVSMEGGADTVADVDNGIYYVSALGNGSSTSFTLTRATDCDQTSATEFHQGVYVYVTSGTLNKDTGWSCVTVDPITVDTTPNAWSQFSGAPSYTYDQGLKKVVTSIQVDLDDGADAQGVGNPSGTRKSGLEFDVDTASGKLRVAVAAAGGIQRNQTAGGIEIKVNTTPNATVAVGAGGLSVLGVPATFTIGGTAVSANVTATNLNTLTAGSSSNADSLHTHSSLVSTSAPKVIVPMTATSGSTVVAGDPVYINASNTVDAADCAVDAKSRVIGLSLSAPGALDAVSVQVTGIMTGILSGASAGAPYYLATTHGLSNALPSGGKRVVQCGFALNATDLFIRIVDYGKKAA